MNSTTQLISGEPSPAAPRRTVGQAALTPLLDTLFLLLFSVLAASDGAEASADTERAKREEEVQLELPSVMDDGESAASTSDEAAVIAIDADGAVTLDGAMSKVDSPIALATSLADMTAGTAFEIRAHADARHAVVVEVLHELREAGFLDVSLIATKRTSGVESIEWGRQPR